MSKYKNNVYIFYDFFLSTCKYWNKLKYILCSLIGKMFLSTAAAENSLLFANPPDGCFFVSILSDWEKEPYSGLLLIALWGDCEQDLALGDQERDSLVLLEILPCKSFWKLNIDGDCEWFKSILILFWLSSAVQVSCIVVVSRQNNFLFIKPDLISGFGGSLLKNAKKNLFKLKKSIKQKI